MGCDSDRSISDGTPALTTNLLSYRMDMVPVYENAIREKCKTKYLDSILQSLDQDFSKDDTDEDKRTRILALVSDPRSTVPYETIDLIIKKINTPEIKAELTALKLDTTGSMSVCKSRLLSALAPSPSTSTNDQVFTFLPRSGQVSADQTDSANTSSESKQFCFSSSLPSHTDFLKSSSKLKTKLTARNKRKKCASISTGVRGSTTFGLASYLKNLESAEDRILDEELNFLNLGTEGSSKAKRKRIRNRITNPIKSTSVQNQNSDIHSRLDVLEKSNVSISDAVQAIKSEVTNISICLADKTSNSPHPAQSDKKDDSGLAKLTKTSQEIDLTLEKTSRAVDDLKTTLKDTVVVKRDLETWRDSVFRSQDSEKIEKILDTLTSSKLPRNCDCKSDVSSTRKESQTKLTAKAPGETRTNSKIPGLPPEQTMREERSTYRRSERETYRREDHQNRNGSKKKKISTRQTNRLKVVLLTDSVMQPFKPEEFPRCYDVDVVIKKNLDAVKSDLTAVAQEVACKRPDAVYVHLATQDIVKDTPPVDVVDGIADVTESILRETSQNCKVIISHPVSCNVKVNEFNETSQLIHQTVVDKTDNSSKSVFWKRVTQNKNSNFYSADGASNPALFIGSGRVNLSNRGLRVIMGNFRHSLHSRFNKTTPRSQS